MTEPVVIIPRAELEDLRARINNVEKQLRDYAENDRAANSLRARVNQYSKHGRINGSGIRKIMNWSATTLWRRVNAAEIPVTTENGRHSMDTEEFIEWYNNQMLCTLTNKQLH